jgi:hypothetical protein
MGERQLATKPKPGDWVAIKVRIREETRRKLERIAILDNKTINGVIGEILQAAALAHQAGLGYGSETAIKAIQSSSAAFAVEETLKRLNVELTQKSEGSK